MKRFPHILLFAVPLVLLLLSGCAAGITGVELDQTSTALRATTVCDPTGAVCGVSDADIVPFRVLGQGVCGQIGIDFGDGIQLSHQGDFTRGTASPGVFLEAHRYGPDRAGDPLAWPGPKTVRAFSVANCVGEARLRVNILHKTQNQAGNTVFSPTLSVGIAPTPTACNSIPGFRNVRKGSTVSVSEVPGGPKMSFGCGGDAICRDNNTSGNSGPTHAGFPFPDMRRHSLVLRILSASGEQHVQGGPRTHFVATETGPLEFCVNDTISADNTGAWGITVTVDETTVP